MPRIHLKTIIKAPVERIFNLSRSIDLHQRSMSHTSEKAIAGRTSGLIEQNETVTWQAKHLFAIHHLTVAITWMKLYSFFQDEMIKGDFKVMIHQHHFATQADNTTMMMDDFYFESPYGAIGRLANKLFLTSYLRNLLITRNRTIKQYAETDQWKTVLHV